MKSENNNQYLLIHHDQAVEHYNIVQCLATAFTKFTGNTDPLSSLVISADALPQNYLSSRTRWAPPAVTFMCGLFKNKKRIETSNSSFKT